MKAILEFNLNDPEDKEDHLRCVKSSHMINALWDIDQYLRTGIKFNEKDWQEVRDELCNIMDGYGINFDELIS